jgi:hypothetical protein
VTAAVVLDLLAGAARQWIRAVIVPPDPPISMDNELWRGWRRAAGGALAIGAIAWPISNELARRQVLSEDYGWLLMTGMLHAAFRTLIVQIRYNRLQYRRTLGFTPAPSPEQMVALGIGPTEFWICMVFILLSTCAYWTNSMRHSWEIAVRWGSLFVYLNILRSSTRADIARRQWLIERGIAERDAKRMA